ncbi:MAG: acetyl-CoA carboxylase carboxyl transferase subunit alpha/beta [Deltaproteobacteria bacterium]|nr:acetyl-CoA carboxylase carboxyl transferase subunit alpha/beta [Deltaproteobacteria bacterium]
MSKTDLVEMFKRRTRHPQRPRSSEIIARVFGNFRHYPATGGSLVVGESDYLDQRVVVIGQEKPKPEQLRSEKDLQKLNWGMLTADEHASIMGVLKQAAAAPQNTVILSLIDTYGADISMYSAERFQAYFISHLIHEFLTVPVPTISIVLGEGGSGGALAIQYTDRRAQMDDAIYATAPPESLAAIIFRDPTRIEDALGLLKPTAKDLKARGVIDTVLASPPDVTDTAGFAESISAYLARTVRELGRTKIKKLREMRLKRAETFGHPRRSRLAAWWESWEAPLVSRFQRPPPDVKVVDLSSLTEVSEDYASGQIIDPAHDYIRCGESTKKGSGGGCGRLIKLSEYMENHHVCPFCGQADVLGATGWIDCLADEGSFHELYRNLTVDDILNERDIPQAYRDFLERQADRSPFKESLVTAQATIYGLPVVLAVSEFNFSGGSMGVVFGEKFKLAVDYCLAHSLPLVSVCCSGGARLYEGISALMQMVKTIAAVQRLKDGGLLYVSILGDPSTGGAIASYAAQGDVIIAEPNALIIFAGPRVMRSRGFNVEEKKIRADSLQKLSRQVHLRPDYFYSIRGIHEIAPRSEMKRTVVKYLEIARRLGRPAAKR